MKRNGLSNLLLAGDLVLCILWLGTLNYSFEFNVLLWLVPLVRIWLSFLLYRKSSMSIYPIGMLAVLNAVILMLSYSGMYDLYLVPVERFERSLSQLVGMIPVYKDSYRMDVTMADFLKGFGIFCFSMILPIILYGYYRVKNKLVPSSVGIFKSLELSAYLMAIAAFAEFGLPDNLNDWVYRMLIICAVVFIPLVFYRDKMGGILTRYEKLCVIILLILMVAYFCGLVMEFITPLVLWGLLVAFFGLLKWYCCQKISYKEFAVITFGAWCFWFSQFPTGFLRIAMLAGFVVAMLVFSLEFIKATRRKMLGIGLFLGLSFVIPILCIGYNPCSALHASRVRVCRDYDYSPYGLLYVESEKGRGIRDRYQMVLPAEYDLIKILVSAKPYFKVKKGDLWYIYDLIAHELVCGEGYIDVIPYGKDAFLLKSADGNCKRMVLPYVNKEKQTVIIEDFDAQIMEYGGKYPEPSMSTSVYRLNDCLFVDMVGSAPQNEQITVYDKHGRLLAMAARASELTYFEYFKYLYDSKGKHIGFSTLREEPEDYPFMTDSVLPFNEREYDVNCLYYDIIERKYNDRYVERYHFVWDDQGNMVKVYDPVTGKKLVAPSGKKLKYKLEEGGDFWTSDIRGGDYYLKFYLVPIDSAEVNTDTIVYEGYEPYVEFEM